jgi:hypothetical protein
MAYRTAEPGVRLATAVRRHWFVFLLPIVLLVAAAVALGLKRTPQYTARANLSIGAVYVNNPAGIASVIQGTESLGAVYSRLIGATAVQESTARRLGDGADAISGHVSATPIPESPMLRVTAAANSEASAVALANAASAALADYVSSRDRSREDAQAVSAEFRRASLSYQRRLAIRRQAQARYAEDPSEANQRAYEQAAAALDNAELKRDALRARYDLSVQGVSSQPPLEVFATATDASSDRYARLQALVFVGLIGGLLAGAALALLRAAGTARRGRG